MTKLYSFTIDELTEVANDALDAFVSALHEDGQISTEIRDILLQHRIVVAQTSFWGRMWTRLFRPTQSTTEIYYNVVYMLPSTTRPTNQSTTEEQKNA